MPADQIDSEHDSRSLLGFIRQRPFEPGFGPVREFTPVREHLNRLSSCCWGEVVGQVVGVRLFMAADIPSNLTRTSVHPDELISYNTSIAVEHLHVDQTVCRDLSMSVLPVWRKRYVRRQRAGAESDEKENALVVTPTNRLPYSGGRSDARSPAVRDHRASHSWFRRETPPER